MASGVGKEVLFNEDYLYIAISVSNDAVINCMVSFPVPGEPIKRK